MKEKYFIYLQKKSCTRQFESKLSLRSLALSLYSVYYFLSTIKVI